MRGALGRADQGPKAQTGRKSSGDFRGAEPMGRVPRGVGDAACTDCPMHTHRHTPTLGSPLPPSYGIPHLGTRLLWGQYGSGMGLGAKRLSGALTSTTVLL